MGQICRRRRRLIWTSGTASGKSGDNAPSVSEQENEQCRHQAWYREQGETMWHSVSLWRSIFVIVLAKAHQPSAIISLISWTLLLLRSLWKGPDSELSELPLVSQGVKKIEV